MTTKRFVIGSMVRAERPLVKDPKNSTTITGRAIIATTADAGRDDDSVCIIWEPTHPRPIALGEGACRNFLITPKSIDRESEQDEATVKLENLQGLLPFENTENGSTNEHASARTKSKISEITMWKERGDRLLRLGDASSASSYYEKALFDSSQVSIGGTVIIPVEGFPRIAEVDCVEEDDGIIDVTLVSGEERSVKSSSVLLGVMESDDDKLQERILLNLTRCTLQLSDLDVVNRTKYLKSALLAASLVLALSAFRENHDDESFLPANAQTALLFRAKANSGLSKWKNAMADARQLIKCGNKQQGNKLLASLERKKKIQSRTDKKLAKEVCLWVQSATSATSSIETTDVSGDNSTSTSYSSKTFISRNIRKSDASSTDNMMVEGAPQNEKTSRFLQWLSHMLSTLLHFLGLCSKFILPVAAAMLISHCFSKG